ncbi:transposable element Tcb2 transposase [Trichonephila clavipes]|nr:transposable element Tcb2 transposase [Trichonephila clavipes]
MGLQFLFMDDNAPCHRTVAAEQLLESRRLAARSLPPVTIRELRLALQDEWAAMPQQLIDTLILSMGRRCETCLAVREIISPTKDRMFLAGHPSQGMFSSFSRIALHATFSIKLLFIPLISLLGPRKRYKGDEIVMPNTIRYNLRRNKDSKGESRPTIEMRTQQGGPVRAWKSRENHYSPYIEEQASSRSKNIRRRNQQQNTQ